MEKKLYELKIDPEFKSFFPPLPKTTYDALEVNINRNGCIEPLSVWQGMILDGHNRYQICHENNVPFEYVEIELENRDKAKLWMLQKQNDRRTIPVFQRCELVYGLKAAIIDEVEQGRRAAISNYRQTGTTWSQSQSLRTADRLAQYALVSRTTWKRISFIIENADESLKSLIRDGKKKIFTAYKELKGIQETSKSVTASTCREKSDASDVSNETFEDAENVETSHASKGSSNIEREFNGSEVTEGTDEQGIIEENLESDLEEIDADKDTHSCEANSVGSAENLNDLHSTPSSNDSSDSSDWWDLVRCSGTDREYVPEPESELIGGNKTIVHLDKPIEMYSHEPERNPCEFYYVKDQVRFAMQTMLKELKVGIYQLKTEDFDKRDELLAIVEDGYNQAKQLINEETGRK